MSLVLDDPVAAWAATLIVGLPVLVLGFGELAERLRQRESVFHRTVTLVRNWVLPLFALWALVVLVFEADPERPLVGVLATAAIVAATAALVALLRGLVTVARRRSDVPGGARIPGLLLLLPRVVVLVGAGWIILGNVWRVDISGFVAALGVGSLVISLALQPTLSGIASGLLLLADRPFNPGDWIRVGELDGRVVDVNWRSSRIQDRNGDLHIVPNSHLADAGIVNFDEPRRLHRVVVPVQVAYSNAPTRAKEMLLAAARATPGVLDDPPPGIRVVQIDDPLMGYEADLWIDDYTIAPRVFSDFGSLVWYQSHRMDVPLPSPAYDLYHHDPIQEAADSALGPIDLAARIREAPMLADLPESDLQVLATAATVTIYREGETILTAGERSDLFVIRSGSARVIAEAADGSVLDVLELGAGDVFGLMAALERSDEPPKVVAVTDCEVVIIDGDAAGTVASRNPDLADALNSLLLSRRRRLERVQGFRTAVVTTPSPAGNGATASGDGDEATQPDDEAGLR